MSNRSKRIFQWLRDHPDEEDEAIDNDLWLDHDAGKYANKFIDIERSGEKEGGKENFEEIEWMGGSFSPSISFNLHFFLQLSNS